jgi:sugar phosphate isomerase/epimerase
MNLLFLCPRWGSESLSPLEFIRKARETGYDGVEIGLADGDKLAEETAAIAKSEGLVLVTQHYLTLDTNVDRHLEAFEKRLRHAASLAPLFVNSHTGRDLFDLRANLRVFDIADRVAADTGVPVYHETHRGRCLHSPWRTAELLAARPKTHLVFDMSHWCNVCESLCEDQSETIERILPAVRHIHARVGHAQGPQVSDPRAPEWQHALEAHQAWWRHIFALRKSAGARELTITPEFGPPPYMPTLPFTQIPVASQWEINFHMMHRLKEAWV